MGQHDLEQGCTGRFIARVVTEDVTPGVSDLLRVAALSLIESNRIVEHAQSLDEAHVAIAKVGMEMCQVWESVLEGAGEDPESVLAYHRELNRRVGDAN